MSAILTETYSAKLASVHELKQFLAGKLFGIRKYCIVPVLYENNHLLTDHANAVIVRTLPRKSLGLTFYGLYLSYDNVFSIECIFESAISAKILQLFSSYIIRPSYALLVFFFQFKMYFDDSITY